MGFEIHDCRNHSFSQTPESESQWFGLSKKFGVNSIVSFYNLGIAMLHGSFILAVSMCSTRESILDTRIL